MYNRDIIHVVIVILFSGVCDIKTGINVDINQVKCDD